MKNLVGKTINGEYRVVEVIGEGAFGVVYRCVETSLDRPVALKMLTKSEIDERSLKQFLAEGKNLAALNHPNVIQIYRLGHYDEKPYIVMELVEGTSLRNLCKQNTLSIKQALKVMSQVALGLAAIHERGILHRDLSRNNIVVTSTGIAKILDLGLSTVGQTLATVSIESKVVGTILYMAPEVIQGKRATYSSDVFSFGVLLYETLAGRSPFQEENAHAVMYSIINREPPPLAEAVPDLPEEICSLVNGCLEKNPSSRSQNLIQISDQLRDVAGLTSSGFYPPLSPSQITEGSGSGANPYLNRVMVKRHADFVGRVREVRRIYARLNARPAGSISIVGDRRIGKSSLLNYVYMSQNRNAYLDRPESVIMLFVDLQEESGMTLQAFVRKLMRLADEELKGRVAVDTDAREMDAFKDLVRNLHEAGMRLVILFDEFEIVTRNPNFSVEFFAFLRFLANHYDVVYLTSSSEDLQTLCHTKAIADSPFFNIFTSMRLTVFDEKDARKLIVEPSPAQAGHDLESHVNWIQEELSGRFPIFLQIACCAFLEYFDEAESSETDVDYAAVRETYYAEAEDHYRFIWEHLNEQKRTVVENVIQGKAVPEAIRHVLADLKKGGYIREGEDGDRLFSATFKQFVQESIRDEKAPSLWKRLLGRADKADKNISGPEGRGAPGEV